MDLGMPRVSVSISVTNFQSSSRPRPPSSPYILSLSAFFALLFILPSSILPTLPLPTTHTVLTLIFLLLLLRKSTTPNILHGSLLFAQCVFLHYVPILFVPITAHAVIKSRIVLAGTLGTTAHLALISNLIVVWVLLISAPCFFFFYRFIKSHMENGGTEQSHVFTPLFQLLSSLKNGNEQSSAMKILLFTPPLAVGHAIVAYILSTGSSVLLLLPDGSVGSQLRVQDVVSYGVAGAAGLAITTSLLPPMLCTLVDNIWPALCDVMDDGCAVLLRIVTQVLVSVAVAESELRIGEGNVFWVLLFVAAIQFVYSSLNHVAVEKLQHGLVEQRYVLRATQAAFLGAACYVAWGRLMAAILAEGGARAVM